MTSNSQHGDTLGQLHCLGYRSTSFFPLLRYVFLVSHIYPSISWFIHFTNQHAYINLPISTCLYRHTYITIMHIKGPINSSAACLLVLVDDLLLLQVVDCFSMCLCLFLEHRFKSGRLRHEFLSLNSKLLERCEFTTCTQRNNKLQHRITAPSTH